VSAQCQEQRYTSRNLARPPGLRPVRALSPLSLPLAGPRAAAGGPFKRRRPRREALSGPHGAQQAAFPAAVTLRPRLSVEIAPRDRRAPGRSVRQRSKGQNSIDGARRTDRFGEGFWTPALCDGGGEAPGPASESHPRRKPRGGRALEGATYGDLRVADGAPGSVLKRWGEDCVDRKDDGELVRSCRCEA
jgi:hypothetical protein